jgi:hypothetical protein
MLSQIKNYFLGTKSRFPAGIVKHTFFKDATIADTLYSDGFYIADILTEKDKHKLVSLYQKKKIEVKQQDGQFYPILNQITSNEINTILHESLSKVISNFKSVSAFAVKTPGEKSVVPLHQDLAVLNEKEYSLLHTLIPLQDIHATNGPLNLIPRTHHIFTPYRCGTIPPILKYIENELTPYFIPIYLKFGQVLFFDARLFHYSPPNRSLEDRVITMCRISPIQADYITYFKDDNEKDGKIEMWKQPENYLINKHESEGENERPVHATFLGYKYGNTSPISIDEFNKLRKTLGIVTRKHN